MPAHAVSPHGAAAGEGFVSTYVDMQPSSCDTKVEEPEDGPAYSVSRCKAPDGSIIKVVDYDARMIVTYGEGDPPFNEPTIPSFNTIGKKLEWITRDGIPVATILRWYLDTDAYAGSEYDDGTGRSRSQVLKVTKLSREGACTMAFIDARANRNANALARQEAYRADDFTCGEDTPYTAGKLHFHFGLDAQAMGLDTSRSQN